MCEAAVVSKAVNRPMKSRKDIKVRRFGGECHGCRGKRGFAIESGAGEYCAGQEVCDGLQRKVLTRQCPQRKSHLCHARLACLSYSLPSVIRTASAVRNLLFPIKKQIPRT